MQYAALTLNEGVKELGLLGLELRGLEVCLEGLDGL